MMIPVLLQIKLFLIKQFAYFPYLLAKLVLKFQLKTTKTNV